MAKISDLSDGGSLLPTDDLVAVRSGANVKVKADNITVDRIDLGDNEKIRLGDSQDLEIYHSASDSIINDNGTGSLKLQQGGSTKLEVTTTGIDVTGIVTADGLTLDGTATIDGASGIPLTLDADAGANTNLQFSEGGALRWYLRSVTSSNDFNFYGNSQSRLNIGSGGDISFYDTSGNAKFFWDASTERLGLGTSSPQRPLHLSIGTDNTAARFESSDTEVALEFIDTAGTAYFRASGGYIKMGATQSDSLTILDGGNVGIGTASPSVLLDLESASPIIRLTDSDASGTPECQISGAGGDLILAADRDNEKSSSLIKFEVDGSEAMRIDSSGRVGVGTTPSHPLHVVAADGTLALFSNGVDADFNIKTASAVTLLTPSTGTLAFGTSNTERMRIDSSGNVGIGRTNPSSYVTDANSLYVKGQIRVDGVTNSAATPALLLDDSNSGLFAGASNEVSISTTGSERLRIGSAGHASLITGGAALQWQNGKQTITGASDSNDLTYRTYEDHIFKTGTSVSSTTDGTERMRIDSSGNVGINETNPQFKLDVENVGGDAIRINAGADFSGLRLTSTAGEWSVRTASDALIFYDVTSASEVGRFDSSGNLGINQSSPSTTLHVGDGSDADRGVVTIEGAGGEHLIFSESSTHPHGANAFAIRPASGTSFIIQEDGASTPAVVIESGGDFRVKSGSIIVDTSGDGIFLGGTAAGNKLDDYEEGTYTAAVTSGSGTITLNTSYDTLGYTKIGQLVHVQGTVVISAISSPSGELRITLPFAATAGTEQSGASRTSAISYFNGTGVPNGANYYLTAIMGSPNSSLAIIYGFGHSSAMDASSADWVGVGSEIYVSFTYVAS